MQRSESVPTPKINHRHLLRRQWLRRRARQYVLWSLGGAFGLWLTTSAILGAVAH